LLKIPLISYFDAKLVRTFFAAARDPNRLWIFLDQAVVSGSNFLILFILARHTDAVNVGYYALAISVVVILQGLQDSIITRPYLVHQTDPDLVSKDFAGGALLLCLLISVSAAVFFATLSFVEFTDREFENLSSVFPMLSIAIPAYLMREFSRRFLMSKLLAKKVFVWDFLGLVFVIISLMVMSYLNALDANGALLAISLSYGSLFSVWIITERGWFSFRLSGMKHTFVRCWKMGKWLLPDRMASEFRGYLNHWLSLIVLGAASTGAFAACLSIVALSNPFVMGMLNFMAPKSVSVIQIKGIKGLRSQMFEDVAIMASTMFGFAIVLSVFGADVLGLIFPRNNFSSYSTVLTILAFAIAIAASSGPVASALITARKSKQASGISISMLFTQLLFAPICMSYWGLEGAAYTLLVVEVIGLIARLKLVLVLNDSL
jgi:O-antigen/teichoic acid export membrane protein